MDHRSLFARLLKIFREWIKSGPTGNFGISIRVTKGSIRGDPKFIIEEDVVGEEED